MECEVPRLPAVRCIAWLGLFVRSVNDLEIGEIIRHIGVRVKDAFTANNEIVNEPEGEANGKQQCLNCIGPRNIRRRIIIIEASNADRATEAVAMGVRQSERDDYAR